jgi:hypothetical protein
MPDRMAVCRLPAHSAAPLHLAGNFLSVTRTPDEISIVCLSQYAPEDSRMEDGWRAFRIDGQIDFGVTGVLESLINPLAVEKIGVFAISTFDTDYVLVHEAHLEAAIECLRNAGHRVLS